MTDLPGEPMASGFRFRPTSEVPEADLPEAARRRVLRKMESVDAARRAAATRAHSAMVG